MNITKKKIPKGLNYPLSSVLLNEALVTPEFTIPITLRYSDDSQLLIARFYLRRLWDDTERFVISSGAVESAKSESAIEYLAKSVVAEFVSWAHEVVSLPANSTRFTGHQFLQWSCPKNEYKKINTVSIRSLIADRSQ